MANKLNQAKVIKLAALPLEEGPTLDGKDILDQDEYSVKWMVKKRPFADRYSTTSSCDIVYFILNDGYAFIDGEKIELTRGDTVHVPKNSAYYISAGTECVAFCQPRFKRD